MRIGTLGSGLMTAAIVPHWIAAGHDVMIGGRNAENARKLADTHGVAHGNLAEVAEHGEVLLLAVRSEGVADALDLAGASRGTLAGKVIVDCGNAVNLADYSQVRWDGRSLAEEVEFRSMGGHVVKAFNTCLHEVWRTPRSYGGRRLRVPYCGADEAKERVRDLITAVGVEGLDIGDLSQARHLEAMAIIMIRLLRAGIPPLSAFALVEAGEPL
jgi:8-hydroxy-5-deazaflavin:NADPH oxidoreductase